MTRSVLSLLTVAASLAFTAPLSAQEKLPPDAKLTKIEAHPSSVALKHPYDYAQLLLTGVLDNGDRVDVTRMVTFETPAKVVKLNPTGLVRPVADGGGEIKASLAGKSVKVPVKVGGQKEPYEV